MNSTRTALVVLALNAIVAGFGVSTADALILVQRPGEGYLIFEAETYDSLVSHDGKGFVPVDRTPTMTTAFGTDVLPANSNASAQAALIDNPTVPNSDHSSTVTYKLIFRESGTYRMYVRDSAFEDDFSGDGSYGNEDSFYRPPTFNAPATVTQHGYSGQTEGNFAWRNLGGGVDYTVAPSDVGKVLGLNIDDRESGFSLDRIALSKNAGESSSGLDNKVNASGLPFGVPGGVVDLDWWANQTANAGVYQATPGGARLDNVDTGFIEGTILLPSDGAWLIDMPFRSDESSARDPNDAADLFINGAFVGTALNTPAAATTLLSTVVYGSSFDYRVEFSSGNTTGHLHMQSWPGFATSIIPEPTTLLVWSLLATLGVTFGWRRR